MARADKRGSSATIRQRARVNLFTDKAGKANGLAFDRDGYLLACDGADGGGRCVTRWNVATGGRRSVVDRYQGQRFNSPNDLSHRLATAGFISPIRSYGGKEPRELAETERSIASIPTARCC